MLQNIPKEKIIEIVKQGPTFPAKIAKQLGGGGETMLIGAILSTLISTGEICVSTLKVGGSPLYYIPDQESKLEEFIDKLNEKDKRAFNLLKQHKVLSDSEQDPLTRVSLRTIKDFAKPFELIIQGQKVLFWKFYSIPKDEAESIAKNVPTKPPIVQQTVEQTKPIIESARVVEETKHADAQTILDSTNLKKIELEKDTEHKHAVHKSTTKTHEHTHSKASKSEPKPKKVKVQKSLIDFFELITKHILSKNLDIISKEKIKKTEYDLILKNHQTNEYIYCKAKDKTSISEGDLAPAMIFAQNKKMPCLFLTTGELTKKAESILATEFGNIQFERMLVK